jgi:hypothetical protein
MDNTPTFQQITNPQENITELWAIQQRKGCHTTLQDSSRQNVSNKTLGHVPIQISHRRQTLLLRHGAPCGIPQRFRLTGGSPVFVLRFVLRPHCNGNLLRNLN